MRAAVFNLNLIGILLCGSARAFATEPSENDVECMASILRSAPNALSVRTAADWVQHSNGGNGKPVIAKGVEFKFRRNDGVSQTIRVYLTTQYATHFPEPRENVAITANSGLTEPIDNGRFSLELLPPYPREWYPQARNIRVAPNGEVKYIRQDSTDHPLYGLWRQLDQQCRIDNLNIFPDSPTP